ncbi:hypothetical protein BZG36_05008 [Bifiguratus adelaidae]|uniref:Peptidase M20 domain-containing protein 2 n=1 Tax=Bifiguratus adelaidae TaxID=1938954 RepID=A0A261XU92_9FUNG|nr:hypothetical protein BZG36_05008 [Bifiguratus adelaidae]
MACLIQGITALFIKRRSSDIPKKVQALDAPPRYETVFDIDPVVVPKEKAADVTSIVEHVVDTISKDLREISLKLHAHPEIAWKEHMAHDLLTDYMEKQGFAVTRSAFGLDTAFRAEYQRNKGGAKVAFCSEYDALPGVGHGCGHNLIAVTGVASAVAVKAVLEHLDIPGQVVLLGTPAEEGPGGKLNMIDAGAFQPMDVVLMGHPGGDYIYNKCLAVTTFRVEYFGKPSHASAAPWEGINALDAIVQAYNGLSMLRQQLPTNQRVHGIIQDGGQATNVIPEHTAGQFACRASSKKELYELKEKVQRVFEAAAEATGCRLEMRWQEPHLDVIQNDPLADVYVQHAEECGVRFPPRYIQESIPSSSTDFGNVSNIKPGLHVGFDIGGKSQVAPHTTAFAALAKTEEAHRDAMRASKCLALTGTNVLTDPTLLECVKRWFDENVPKNA